MEASQTLNLYATQVPLPLFSEVLSPHPPPTPGKTCPKCFYCQPMPLFPPTDHIVKQIEVKILVLPQGRSFNRGGASEASVATLTDYVAGARDLSYVRQLSPQANCTTRMRNGCWVSNVWNFFAGKKIWQRKSDPDEYRSWDLVHERPMHSPLSHWGSGSSEVQIEFLYCLVL